MGDVKGDVKIDMRQNSIIQNMPPLTLRNQCDKYKIEILIGCGVVIFVVGILLVAFFAQPVCTGCQKPD